MGTDNNRNRLISFLQAYGIILVVVGHSFVGYGENHPIAVWIYNFHMPLFFFISGYLLYYSPLMHSKQLSQTKMTGSNGFVMKKVKRLLIPYVVISSLAFIPKAYLSRFADRPVELSFDSWWHMLVYPWDNVIIYFWYLPTLFLIMCMVMGCIKLSASWRFSLPVYVILPLLVILYFFNPLAGISVLNLEGVVTNLVYFAAGIYYCMYQEKIERILRLKNPMYLIVPLVVSIQFAYAEGKAVDMLLAFNGILLSLWLGHLYVRFAWRFLDHLDSASYAIYLFSWFPQVACMQILLKLTHVHWIVSAILATLTGLYIPWLVYKGIIYVKKKYKWGKAVALLTGQ